MTQLLIGMASTENEAILMLNRLKLVGIAKDRLGVVAKEQLDLERVSEQTELPKPLKGGGTDGAFGALKGVLAALDERKDQIQTVGQAVRRLAGNQIGEGTDDLVLMLTEAGISETKAQMYETFLIDGGLIVVVECDDSELDEVIPILSMEERPQA